jgi:hypothetical protein
MNGGYAQIHLQVKFGVNTRALDIDDLFDIDHFNHAAFSDRQVFERNIRV